MLIDESISIKQKPDIIWKFWLEVSTDTQWREGFTKAEWTSREPHGIGSSGVHYHEKLGPIPWEVTLWEEGVYFEFIHTGGRIRGSEASYYVRAENDGSRAGLKARIVLPLHLRFLAPLMKGFMKKGLQTDLQKLKKIMEES